MTCQLITTLIVAQLSLIQHCGALQTKLNLDVNKVPGTHINAGK